MRDDLCIHQVCIWKQCDFSTALECLARHEVTKTALWQPMVADAGLSEAKRALSNSEVSAIAVCPMVLHDPQSDLDEERQHQANLSILEGAAELGAGSVITLTGGLPRSGTDIATQKRAALRALERLVPVAKACGVRLNLEPLHPMVCGFRSVISSLEEACEIVDSFDSPDILGVAVDSYALWWDRRLESQILAAGERIHSFHVSDWLADTTDIRLDRGMPGDGQIDNRSIRSWIERAGYLGPVEVEIFSERNWWRQSPDITVETICERLSLL
jgi:sugar phosphate isomerase/epimerase